MDAKLDIGIKCDVMTFKDPANGTMYYGRVYLSAYGEYQPLGTTQHHFTRAAVVTEAYLIWSKTLAERGLT